MSECRKNSAEENEGRGSRDYPLLSAEIHRNTEEKMLLTHNRRLPTTVDPSAHCYKFFINQSFIHRLTRTEEEEENKK